jgi:hypothetical protein
VVAEDHRYVLNSVFKEKKRHKENDTRHAFTCRVFILRRDTKKTGQEHIGAEIFPDPPPQLPHPMPLFSAFPFHPLSLDLRLNQAYLMISSLANSIFDKSIADYHLRDHVDTPVSNPYPADQLEHLLYLKNWIDTVQWHLEDIIRNPSINPADALAIKRRIDSSNQERTDVVEYIDSYFFQQYANVKTAQNASINTESPAWAIDRLSILALKIYHMRIEAERTDASTDHIAACQQKLSILLEQRTDLSSAIDELLSDIEQGKKYMKVYKQMKMYNDPSLNPVLYQQSTAANGA